MKAILIFDRPEDETDLIVALHAMDFALTASDLDEKLRNWLKHGHKFGDVGEALEGVRDELRLLMDERSISLDMVQ